MNAARLGRVLAAVALLAGSGPDARAALLVSSSNTDSVLRYDDATGAFLGVLVTAGSGGLDNPRGLALGPDGSLYVGSRETDSVLRYDATTGAFLGVFVAAGSGGLNGPEDLAFGPDGNLYVASRLSNQVLRYNGATGAFVDNFATGAVPPLNEPLSLVFGTADLFLSNNTGRLDRFDGTTGAFLNSVVEDNPRGLAVGPDGSLYVGRGLGEVVERSQTLAFVGPFVGFMSGGLTGANDLAFGPDGNLYVLSGDNTVKRYSAADGSFLGNFVTAGSGGLSGPSFLLFTPSAAVPEPTGLALAAVGAGVLGYARRRRAGAGRGP
jgi:glucose/arabinose dehydrogenase